MYWEVKGNQTQRVVNIFNTDLRSPFYGSNWGHKVIDFGFWLVPPLLLVFELLIALRGDKQPYAGSLEGWSDLPLGPTLWLMLLDLLPCVHH